MADMQEALDALKDKVLPQYGADDPDLCDACEGMNDKCHAYSEHSQREAAWQRVSALVAALLEIAQRQPDRTWGADLEAQVALKSVGIDVEVKR